MALSPKVYTWLCGCFAALGSILFGYDLGIIASVLPSETFLETVGHPSENEIGLITSLFLLGAFFGSAPSGVIADAIGRRKAIVVGCIIFIIGGTLQTAAQSLRMMMAGRFLAGWGVGQLAHLAPLFQSEIAHSSIRGRLTTLQQFFLGIGAFIASFIGYGCYNRLQGTQAQWRLPLGLQLFPAVPLALLIHAFPESPRWLAMKGRHEEALLCLARLHANGDTSDTFVQSELADIEESIEKDRRESENAWSLLFFEPSNRRRLLLGIVLQFSVQMTGVSAIQYYAPAIFQEVGFDAGKTLLFQSINSVIALLGEAACVLLVDRLGRRWPLISANILSASTFVIGTAIIAIYPADPDDPSGGNKSAHYAFVVMTWVFNLAFSAAIGPISWAYPVEIFGSATRARGTAITSMAAWIANFMIAQVTPIAFHNIGWKYYLVFAICGYTNALTFWAFFPETKGRKLEEMDEFFKHSDWFVPTAKFTPISATQRENEMRAGNAFGGEDIIDSDSKERIDRTEKDRRAMHAERQHTLHASDRRKSKSTRVPKSHGGSRPGSHFSRVDDSDDYIDYATHPDDLLDACCIAEANTRAIPAAPRNVSLAEVIQIKPGRKKKGPEGDFEMVPRPGEVLVLDEDQDELYAGWEDVSLGALRDASNVARMPVSYAAALSRR
ncbi:unnamed protein product [Rhizoctonia solani]|uniref:Major facilitator superfamily (MFS) profile domain-containing protein n=1 Tax=Rhizoctonia solani TaxID=456999 RepID=A0A8H2Y1G2_9AGAM|nr:unnamed protein product [Rhizoctonia solani]